MGIGQIDQRVNIGIRQINRTLLETFRYRLQKAENARNEELLRVNNLATIGELSAGLTHEIITPLTNIKVNLSILNEKQSLKNELRSALLGVEQINSLVNNYLKQVRFEKCSKFFNPISEIKLAETLLEYKIRKSGVKIIHDFPNGIRINGDPTKFAQVIINLIANAIDAYQEAEVRQEESLAFQSTEEDPFKIIEISGKLIKNENVLRMRVLDMASGIPEKHKNKIFDMFFTTKHGKGTGIGLPISRRIIQNDFHGSLKLVSCKSPTIFEIKIPIIKKEERQKNTNEK